MQAPLTQLLIIMSVLRQGSFPLAAPDPSDITEPGPSMSSSYATDDPTEPSGPDPSHTKTEPSGPDLNHTTEPETTSDMANPSSTMEPPDTKPDPRNTTEPNSSNIVDPTIQPSETEDTETADPSIDCSGGSRCTVPPTSHLDTEGPIGNEDFRVTEPFTTQNDATRSGGAEITSEPSERSDTVVSRNMIIISTAAGIVIFMMVMFTIIILLAKRSVSKKHGSKRDPHHMSIKVGSAGGYAFSGTHVVEGSTLGLHSSRKLLNPEVAGKPCSTNIVPEAEYDYIDDSESTSIHAEFRSSDQDTTDVTATSGKHDFVAENEKKFGRGNSVFRAGVHVGPAVSTRDLEYESEKHGSKRDPRHIRIQVGSAGGHAFHSKHVAEDGTLGLLSSSKSSNPEVASKSYSTNNMPEAEYDYIDDSESTESGNSDQQSMTEAATSGKNVAENENKFGHGNCVFRAGVGPAVSTRDFEYDCIENSAMPFTNLEAVPNSNQFPVVSTPGDHISGNYDRLQFHFNNLNGSSIFGMSIPHRITDGDIEYDYIDDTSLDIITEAPKKGGLPDGQIHSSPMASPTDESIDSLLGLYSNGLYGSSVFGTSLTHVTGNGADQEYDYIDDTQCSAEHGSSPMFEPSAMTRNSVENALKDSLILSKAFPTEASTRESWLHMRKGNQSISGGHRTRMCVTGFNDLPTNVIVVDEDNPNQVIISPNPAYGVSIDGT